MTSRLQAPPRVIFSHGTAASTGSRARSRLRFFRLQQRLFSRHLFFDSVFQLQHHLLAVLFLLLGRLLCVFGFFLDDFVDLVIFHAVFSHRSGPHAFSRDATVVHARSWNARFTVFAAVVHTWDVHAGETLRVRVAPFPWVLFLRFDFAGAQLLDFLLHQGRFCAARSSAIRARAHDASISEKRRLM